MLDDNDIEREFDQKTPMQRYGLPVAGVLFMVVCGASAYELLKSSSGPAARPHNEPHITQVRLPPPPPPPPPPKTPPPTKQETPKQREPTPQKAVSKPAPKAPSPPAAVTTSITGSGPGSLAAGNGGGGDCIGSGCGTGDGTGGDKDTYYMNLMQQKLMSALSADDKLKYARYKGTIVFRLDSAGNVVQPEILTFAGDDDVRAEVERMLKQTNSGEKPDSSIVGRKFTARIGGYARG